jgi:acyl carrier protein
MSERKRVGAGARSSDANAWRDVAEHTPELAREVSRVVAQQFEVGLEHVVPQSRLMDDLGADALALVDLAFALEERFDIRILFRELVGMHTVQQATECVERALRRREPHAQLRSA